MPLQAWTSNGISLTGSHLPEPGLHKDSRHQAGHRRPDLSRSEAPSHLRPSQAYCESTLRMSRGTLLRVAQYKRLTAQRNLCSSRVPPALADRCDGRSRSEICDRGATPPTGGFRHNPQGWGKWACLQRCSSSGAYATSSRPEYRSPHHVPSAMKP